MKEQVYADGGRTANPGQDGNDGEADAKVGELPQLPTAQSTSLCSLELRRSKRGS